MENTDLKQLAKRFYFENVLLDEYRENFLKKLEVRKVFDKRNDGYYCSYCKKFVKKHVEYKNCDNVIMPNKDEIWIVNSHYDGCRGWD